MLAMEVETQPQVLEMVERIQRAQDDLHHLYEEVRSYAAPINLQREKCDLAQVWRDAWSHLEVARNGKTVTLREEVDETVLDCEIDSFAVEQVFRNVLENAICACPDCGEIVIRTRMDQLHGKRAVQASVQDNGPGIDPAARKRIFDPFYTTKTKGTGLGMAIARRIVEAHGGRIAVGDHSGVGAEFVVTLPKEKP
jgi:signal transduction histidine kinase